MQQSSGKLMPLTSVHKMFLRIRKIGRMSKTNLEQSVIFIYQHVLQKKALRHQNLFAGKLKLFFRLMFAISCLLSDERKCSSLLYEICNIHSQYKWLPNDYLSQTRFHCHQGVSNKVLGFA